MTAINEGKMTFNIQQLRALAWKLMLPVLSLFLLLCFRTALGDEDFLPPEQAFHSNVRMVDARTAEVRFDIAEGYYLYRERFAFKAHGASLGEPQVPAGAMHFDDTLQKTVETYRQSVVIHIPVTASGPFTLDVTAQGCSEKGLCYPPMTTSTMMVAGTGSGDPAASATSSETGIAAALGSRNMLLIVPMFLVFGLGLAFTPCVLPMLPIMSSIIVGNERGAGRGRSFGLSLSYSAGMAIMYTLFGVAAGLAGHGLAAALQNPWVLGAFALLMALFALSMLGVYQLQMPAAVQQRLTGTSGRQAAGTHAGVFGMGALSSLIVGPCVAAPLAGALLYIGRSGDALVGGVALFSMAAGMSIPLLLIGASAGMLLPRAGAWMEEVKRFFGVLMLGSAWWIVAPVVPGHVQMFGWAALGIGYAAFLFIRRPAGFAKFALGLVFGIGGAIQLAGAVAGGSDPLAPFTRSGDASPIGFQRVKSVAELDRVLASSPGKAVMLDFYADWCVSCKEMEKSTFADPRVRARLGQMLVLQADVTANDEIDKTLLKRFSLFGPPGIIFFDARGQELPAARVIGFQDSDRFMGSLAAVKP
jgi:thiol:disulfide interchange protein DsbD